MIDHLVIDAQDGNDWSALLRIFDLGGRCIFTKQLNTGSIHRINVDFVQGTHVLKLSGDMAGVYKFQRL